MFVFKAGDCVIEVNTDTCLVVQNLWQGSAQTGSHIGITSPSSVCPSVCPSITL